MVRNKIPYYILVGYLCFGHLDLFSQDQKLADSLKVIYHNDQDHADKLELLSLLAFNEVEDLNLALKYAEELIDLAKSKKEYKYLARGYIQKGYKKWNQGDLNEGMNAFTKAIDAAKSANCMTCEGTVYSAIASIYTSTKGYKNAIDYFNKAINVLSQTTDTVALATSILNLGDTYLSQGNYDSALIYFNQSQEIFTEINHQVGLAYNLGNIGMVHANQGANIKAHDNMTMAIEILQDLGDYYPICFYLISMSDIYQKGGDISESYSYAEKSLKLAVQYDLKQQISDAHLKLSELNNVLGNADLSLLHYKEHIAYRDSVTNLTTVQKIADQRTEFEVDLREREIETLEKDKILQQTYIVIAIILSILLLIITLYFRQRFLNTRILAQIKQKEHDDRIKDLLRNHETETLQAMINGKEEERKHLAKELHNHIGSLLATIKVNLNGLQSNNKTKLTTIVELVDKSCQDVRNISHELNIGVSSNFGLVPALKELVGHLKKVNGMMVEFSASLDNIYINSENEILAYRFTQELLSNVLKHSNASEVSVSLTGFSENNLLNILVEDNGDGFDPKNLIEESDGIGLKYLKETIHKLQGEMNVDSRAGLGTTINIDLPLYNPENEM